MEITAIDALVAREFKNILWVDPFTDDGVIGLGETFYIAPAVSGHTHDTSASRLLGRDPTPTESNNNEAVDVSLAQANTGQFGACVTPWRARRIQR